MWIDIHNHSLFGVDDGAGSIEEALQMLEDAQNQGMQAVILTPHYCRGVFEYPVDRIEDNFRRLKEETAKLGLQLYLGCEYHMDMDANENLRSGRCKTLAGGDYVLTEYSYMTEYSVIQEYTGHMLSFGYIPVIAHVERYQCIQRKPALCEELSAKGALIQINADGVLGLAGRNEKKTCKSLLKNRWADVVASDAHNMTLRKSHMAECKELIEKKYGEAYAGKLFIDMPMQIIKNR